MAVPATSRGQKCVKRSSPPRSAFGDVDLLINNAGVPRAWSRTCAGSGDLTEADFEQQLDLNLRAITGLTRLVLPAMIERLPAAS